ncbi:RDD family protein [Arenicella xantha]|uniref:Putative RDD family membrane protein YckC n=1 Tax=Arenicella xantha TaxID=644221 RepID=A0A395JPT2_9GAMM|nr:RDD family protein [Arenicella xantha]RBP51578.1 putative RDD family membrane protein YckC [Arenicella xantha]
MTTPNDTNPYAITPQADLGQTSTRSGANLRYAGFWIRVAATVIDTIILMLVIMPLMFLVYGGDVLSEGNMSNGFWDVMISYVLPAVAYIVLWVKIGGTPGKRLLGLRIVNESTLQNLTWGAAIIRYIGYFVSMFLLFIGYIWVAFDKKKKGLHDYMGSSIVIYD